MIVILNWEMILIVILKKKMIMILIINKFVSKNRAKKYLT